MAAAAAYASLSGIVAPANARIAPLRPPPLSGDAVVGASLRVGTATWTTAPGAASYRWDRCNSNGRACAPIAAGRADTYTLGTADVGHVLVARVTASRRTVLSLGSEVIRAAPGPFVVGGPHVVGIARAGKRLGGTAGTWSGTGAISYAYQWYRCDTRGAHCGTMRGATRQTYTEGAADVGHTLGLAVHATDTAGTTVAYASLVGPVAAADSALASTVQPTLAGVAAVGQSLTVAGGAWSTRPRSVTYRWLRCNANARLCTEIPAATASTYTVSAADRGATLVATVTATAGATVLDALTVASPVIV